MILLVVSKNKSILFLSNDKNYASDGIFEFREVVRVQDGADIDFKNKVIHIQRALTCNYEYGEKVMRMSPTKTQNSVREIPFMGDVEEQLLVQKKQQDQTKENLGDRYRSGEGEFTDLSIYYFNGKSNDKA